MDGQTLGLAGAANTRDLGGLPAWDGSRLRRGVLYRSGALQRLTDADVETLDRLRLATLIDLRHEREIELAGPDRLPARVPGRMVWLPLAHPDHDVFAAVNLVLSGRAGPATLSLLHGEGAAEAMVDVYQWLAGSAQARQVYGAAVRLIAAEDALPVLFHCTAGKDRTGWLSVILLRVLGVAPERVLADYLRTNEHNADSTAFVLGRARERDLDPAVLLPLLRADERYLAAAMSTVELAYGDFDTYLRVGLDLDEETLARLRSTLLEV
jgi:protein-tyrosine phosphatase